MGGERDVSKGLAALGSVQLPLKVISFLLNVLQTRLADPKVYGVSSMS